MWLGGIPSSVLIAEDRLDGGFKEARQFEGQRKAGIVLPGLDRVDRLARDLQPFGQIGLRPIPFSTQYTQPILHLYLAFSGGVLVPTQNQLNIAPTSRHPCV